MNRPKTTQPMTPAVQQDRDLFQTPNYATELLMPYVPAYIDKIWEPCCGHGKIVNVLTEHGHDVLGTDIAQDPIFNALTYLPQWDWQAAITNPPYSLKIKVAKRFIELGKPFALLIPGDWSAWLIDAIKNYDCGLIVPSRRINYITPTGRSGKESAAQFHSVWLTRYFGNKQPVIFVDLTKEMMVNV